MFVETKKKFQYVTSSGQIQRDEIPPKSVKKVLGKITYIFFPPNRRLINKRGHQKWEKKCKVKEDANHEYELKRVLYDKQ